MLVESKIKLRRGRFVEESRNVAIIHLNNIEHTKGVPVLIDYEDGERTSTILAVGTKSGVGPDCYRILSSGVYEIVSDVTEEVPDISVLVNKEIYLYYSREEDTWYFVTYDPSTGGKKFEEVSESNHIFLNSKDNSIWIGVSRKIFSLQDLFEKASQIEDRLPKHTWEELAALRNEKKLNPGSLYLLIDYKLPESSEYVSRDIEGINIVLLATENDEFSEEVLLRGNVLGYDLSSFSAKYCFDNDASRFSWVKADEIYGIVVDENEYSRDASSDIGESLFAWRFEEDIVFTDSLKPGLDSTLYNSEGEELPERNISSVLVTYGGKGVIYSMTDNKNNTAPFDFLSIIHAPDTPFLSSESHSSCTIQPYFSDGKMKLPGNGILGEAKNVVFEEGVHGVILSASSAVKDITVEKGMADKTITVDAYNYPRIYRNKDIKIINI